MHLLFIVYQKIMFTVQDDINIHIPCPNEAIMKRQWTMYVVVNICEVDARRGTFDLVTRVNGVIV